MVEPSVALMVVKMADSTVASTAVAWVSATADLRDGAMAVLLVVLLAAAKAVKLAWTTAVLLAD